MSIDSREPAFNAPWPALTCALIIVGSFATQRFWGGPSVYAVFGLIPAHVEGGLWSGLVTHLFVHGGWLHAGLNAAGALAFGAAVARLLGQGVRGGLLFALFYLVCGIGAGLAYVLLHPGSASVVVGASGAVSALMAGASRLIERPGRLSGFFGPTVLGMAGGWLIINLLAAVMGTTPGVGGGPVAWEAHLAGYALGLLLIGPIARLAAKPRPITEPWAR